MSFGAAVARRLRNRVWLVPDDVLPQIPAIVLQRESQTPRHAHQVFRLVFGMGCRFRFALARHHLALAYRRNTDAHVVPAVRAPATGVAVAHVYPDRAVSTQHPAHFAEHVDQAGDELCRGFFKADLAFYAIVTQTVVGRAGHARMHAFIWQRAHHVDAVAYQYLVELAHI